MQRYRRVLGMTPRTGRIAAKGLFGNHAQRFEWAWAHCRQLVATWMHSDESTLCMRDTNEVVWAPRGLPTPLIEVSKLRCSLHIWGVVWDTGHVFQLYDGHLTATMYIELLEQHILPEKENIGHRVFLLDRHPAHTAKRTQKWLTDHQLDCMVLPTHSPQFNAIEHCWAWIIQRVRELRPDSPAMLQAHLESALDALPQPVIQANLRNAQHNLRAYCDAYRQH